MKGNTQVWLNVVGMLATIWAVVFFNPENVISNGFVLSWAVLILSQFAIWGYNDEKAHMGY